MRVSINGRAPRELSERLRKDLSVGRLAPAAEGLVLSLDEALARSRRGMTVLYGVLGGLAALVLVACLVAAASYEPRDLVVIAPLTLVVGAALAWLMQAAWRRNLARVVARSQAQGQLAAPGTAVRVDDAGLTIGGRLRRWDALALDEIGVVSMASDDTQTHYLDRLTFSESGRPLTLDMVSISNGRAVLDQAWRRVAGERSAD